MNPVSFSDPPLAEKLISSIHALAKNQGTLTVMEVCGTHTMEIGRLGLRPLLPANVRLVSGPGCPVCVTPASYIDTVVEYALEKNITILAFGDMIRVPGSSISLQQAKARGADVRIIVSPIQAVEIAQENRERQFVVTGVGFETTIPAVAQAILKAAKQKLGNVSFLAAHRLVPPALAALMADPALKISAFLLPGHVSAIIGADAYTDTLGGKIPGVVAGFEPLDIVGALHAALSMTAKKETGVRNLYPRIVKSQGNTRALDLIKEVYELSDAMWRGIGIIPGSGLAIREKYGLFDAARKFGISRQTKEMPDGCSCGDVLRGIIRPDQCPLFGSMCTPESPVGPCMVSSEGSCAAFFKYGN